MKIYIAALFCLSLSAQTPQPQPPPITELKAYLTLTDSQVTQLQTLVQSERQANQARVQEINTKETQLRTMLNNNSNDAAALGRLLIEIQALRRQMETTVTNFRNQAVALLNEAQKTKLTALDAAAKLAPAIRQAVDVNLLAPPPPATAGPMAPRRFGPPPPMEQ